MALPTPGPAVAFTLEDAAGGDTAEIRLLKLTGRIYGDFKRTMNGTKVVVHGRNIIEERVYTSPLTPDADDLISFNSDPLIYNISSTPANEIGGWYEYTAVVCRSTDPEPIEVVYRFQVDEDATYTLDSDGRIPFGQVNIDSETPTTTAADLSARSFSFVVYESDVSCATGDGKAGFCAPAWMADWVISDVRAGVGTPGTGSTMNVQLRRVRAGVASDVLSTAVTLDPAAYSVADGVVDADEDDIAAGDMFYVDVDQVHSTPALGLTVTVTITLP